MKTMIAVLAALMISQVASADSKFRSPASPPTVQSSTLCGVLSGECLNGGTCAHYITTITGEHAVLGSTSKIAKQLGDLVEQSVSATGHYGRNGFIITQISGVAACERAEGT
jgi:hypothetical protein